MWNSLSWSRAGLPSLEVSGSNPQGVYFICPTTPPNGEGARGKEKENENSKSKSNKEQKPLLLHNASQPPNLFMPNPTHTHT
jgi:hypothetical protein